MDNKFVISKLANVSVMMNSQVEKNMQILRGRVLLCEEESRLSFVQNPPRGKRSVEVARAEHCRMVRRPDSLYTLTLRFDIKNKYIRETLISEVRQMVTAAQQDFTNQQNKEQ